MQYWSERERWVGRFGRRSQRSTAAKPRRRVCLVSEALEPRWALAADGFESNDYFDEATPLGTGSQTHSSLTIDPAGDWDFFEWTASGNGTLVIDVLFSHGDGDIDVDVYDTDVGRNPRPICSGSPPVLSGPIPGDAPIASSTSGSDNERIVAEVANGQTYWIRAYPFNVCTGSNPDYTLVLNESVPDVFESPIPNDSTGTATDLGVTDQIRENLSIHRGSDEDFYKWESPIDGTLLVDVLFLHELGDVNVVLLDAAENVVDASASSTDDEHVETTVSAGETYFIHVLGSGGSVQPDYDLAIKAIAPPTISEIPNPQITTIDTPITINFTVDDPDTPLVDLTLTGTATTGVSSFSFSGTGTSRSVTITPLPGVFGAGNITITVEDTDGLSDDTAFLLFIVFPDPAPEVADVLISGQSWDAGVGPFSLFNGPTPEAALPWANMDQIEVVFSAGVEVDIDALNLMGVNVPQYVPSGFNHTPGENRATWTFGSPIEVDRLRLHLSADHIDDQVGPGGTKLNDGTDYELPFFIQVLPGDTTRDGTLTITDLANVAVRMNVNLGDPTYETRFDLNASGGITITDLALAAVQFGSGATLPVGDPAPAPALVFNIDTPGPEDGPDVLGGLGVDEYLLVAGIADPQRTAKMVDEAFALN